MNKIDWTAGTAMTPEDLPETITAYLAAHQARDVERAVALYTRDATVTDEGRDYHGPDQIGSWLSSAGSEYTYTTTLTHASRLDPSHFDVVHRLEGDFPGGIADLHFRFTLDGRRIARLIIEP